MKALSLLVVFICSLASLFAQNAGSFPTQNAAGGLYVGTDSDLSFSLREGNRFLSGGIGVVGQYFVSENLALGLGIGVGGSRSFFDNDASVFRSNSLSLSTQVEAFFYPSAGRGNAVQPFVKTQISLNRGRAQNVPENGSPQNTPTGSTSLALAPGLAIALPNDAMLNISASLLRLGLSRQGLGNGAERSPFVSGGLNSGISLAYIKAI
ncbi:MAG: outer membrane beta-barrel protein [Bacteroidota bacterium]